MAKFRLQYTSPSGNKTEDSIVGYFSSYKEAAIEKEKVIMRFIRDNEFDDSSIEDADALIEDHILRYHICLDFTLEPVLA